MASAFGARLRRLREAKGLTLQQVAGRRRLHQGLHLGT
jgi:transcriptional regulator with XRE-family HTH domain